MELIRGLHNIKAHHFGCVLTIGKFDGVHLGHRAVLKKLMKKASELNLPSTVMVFEPQPEELFMPELAPARLSLLRDKYAELEKIGIDRLLCIRFTRSFAGMSPENFIANLLGKRLGVKFLVVGDDFKFGYKRQGDFLMLQSRGQESGFDVVSTQSFTVHDSRISSTALRVALLSSNFALANEMLGRAFCINGKVIHGEKNGRTIGYPTANLLLKRHKSPISGVFACKVHSEYGMHDAVVNIGVRPTLNGQRMQLEAHLFDFEQDLYGKRIRVEFVDKIRDEIKFSDFLALKNQIIKDAEQAKTLLASQRSNGKNYE